MALKNSIGDDADFKSTRTADRPADTDGAVRREIYDFRGDVQVTTMQQQTPRYDNVARMQQMQ